MRLMMPYSPKQAREGSRSIMLPFVIRAPPLWLWAVLLISSVHPATSQKSGLCGDGTYLQSETLECLCLQDMPPDENLISLAGIFDLTTYDWGPDIFNVTVGLLNRGYGKALPTGVRVEYKLENANCDEATAVRGYWKLRTENGNKPMDGVIGARCSGASTALARIAELEDVPQLSPASNSEKLSDKQEFPLFSRLVAPNDETGEVGAIIALLRYFDWERVTILSTDTQFSKDLETEFRKHWVGKHDGWVGEIAHSDTIRLASDGSVDRDSVQQALDSVPVDDPTDNSRIIFLAAHVQHAMPILQMAHSQNFQPDTIWVGPSSWAGRTEYPDFSWLPPIPGYLGIAPFRNRDTVYQTFLKELQAYQASQGRQPLTELPTFAAEFVDSIRALSQAIGITRSKGGQGGKAVVDELRKLEFSGVSGYVQLNSLGDRKNPKYSIFNAQTGRNADGSIAWTDIGTTSAKIGSVELFNGIESVCFSGLGCGLSEPPEDTYPVPRDKLPTGIVVLIVVLTLLLIGATLKYWRSRRSKKSIVAELEAFRESVVGMRAAECMYIPKVQTQEGDVEQATDLTGTVTISPLEAAQWMWKETDHVMGNHAPSSVYGDPKDCWILYTDECARILEDAYKKGSKECKPLKGYVVNLEKMQQTKEATGFVRDIRRVVDTVVVTDDDDVPKKIDLGEVEIGDDLPDDLEGEPRMVLVKGDVVQISQQRQDGWAFGTKLHHADEATARELLLIAIGGLDEDEANVFADTGWFQLEKTRMPTADDLAALQMNVGNSGALDPPSHWDPVIDASTVQKHVLPAGDTERAAVEKAFMSTLDQKYKVLKVERIQNLAMYQSYVVKRQTICYRETGHVAGDDNDDVLRKAQERFERRWLFHGTNIEVMDKILQQGFNRSFCGKNATAYGKGVYFARDASYSAHPMYAVPDSKDLQYMMACSVVVGEYCRGKHDALTPDVRDVKTQSLYDSTVGTASDSLSNPSIYVTYHDSQAYPEYLITFKKKR